MVLTPLQRVLFFVLAIAAAGLVVAILIATVAPADDAAAKPESATYRLDDLTPGEPVFFRPSDMGGAYDRPYGIWLVRLEDGEVLALFSRDRHLGQSVERFNWPPGLDDPTYGSPNGGAFSLDGRSLNGPAARDLDRFPVRVEDGLVRIDTTQLILGECTGTSRSSTFPCSRAGEEERWDVKWHEVRGQP